MTWPLWYPDAVHDPVAGRPGRPWKGGTGNRRLVLHTLEYKTRWPSDQGVWPCPHITYNPWTRQCRQHIPFNKAAYALRHDTNEDDAYVWQVELWGIAAEVPTYDDTWYAGLGHLVGWFQKHMDVPDVYPPQWAGTGSGAASSTSPYRMTQTQWEAFSGVLGHQHFGRGVDTHWDPGALNISKLRSFITMGWQNDITDDTWMTMFYSGVPGIVGHGRYYCSNDGTVNWQTEPYEGLAAPWGSNPHWNTQTQKGAKDGAATDAEKINALNYLLKGFSVAAGDGRNVWSDPWKSGLP